MVTTYVAGFLLLWDAGYQPRHRSTRRAALSAGWQAQRTRDDPSRAWAGRPAGPGSPAAPSWMASPPAEPAYPDQHPGGQLRRMLAGCALDDLIRIVPEIVQVIALSSVATMTTAWNDFRQANRDPRALCLGTGRWSEYFERANAGSYPEEDAVVIRLGQADDALWLITKGHP
jgi:hypothetical protein